MGYSTADGPHYDLNNTGEFVIADYNSARPFSSFFPGIAGANGIPMWVFYVNRGQCICSMGIRDKNHPIMEFQPANMAYNTVTRQGFRTFIAITRNSQVTFYEPFQSRFRDRQLDRDQRLIISPSHVAIEETNRSLNLKFEVEYFNVPQDDYAGLVRTLRIHNLGSDDVSLRGLDGLPVIVPYGVDDSLLKNMRRTIEAFVEVCNLERRVPFFRGKVEPDDRPDVRKITAGNFYFGFDAHTSSEQLIAPIVDPKRIFGAQSDFDYPRNFLESPHEEIGSDQILEGQLPCAMGLFDASIHAGETFTYTSIVGHASSIEELNRLVPRIATREYVTARAQTNRELIDEITQTNLVCSQEPALDYYIRQNFLDNTMRGGFPFTFAGEKSRSTLYLFSRKHGDLERDYNDFVLTPTHYSQGNGNYRDINQNRRSDLLFNPEMGAFNVEYFYNLIQLDGFNPLVLKEILLEVDDHDAARGVLRRYFDGNLLKSVESCLSKPFTPGALMARFKDSAISPPADTARFLGELLDHCSSIPDTDHGEGFWTDHWTYNLDLLENYLAVYPDNFQALLFERNRFTFYNNAHGVRPREEKYVLWEGTPMQLGAVVHDEEKAAIIDRLDQKRKEVRTAFGEGDVYRTSLCTKILCLIVNKLASLDPAGVGVEMEAGKPSWYDALNGLPGLFGSSLCETLEIKRHVLFLMQQLREQASGEHVTVFEELSELMDSIHGLLSRNVSPFEFWDEASAAKERYRDRTRLGVSGREVDINLNRIREFLEATLVKLEEGIEKARDEKSGIVFTYFRHEVLEYEIRDKASLHQGGKSKPEADELVHIRPKKFKQIPLPLFLEGPVHYLRCMPGTTSARELAAKVKKSQLYDKSLKMYKVNASLANEPMEIGRARVFSPGWLENESVWLHMEYKYLLELLRNELYEEFYDDFKNVCVPFMNPEVYGRSILENSSFIVSSAHPDKSIHGNGYVARLSGATAEFIQILMLMAAGPRPFRLDADRELRLHLRPSLPGWLFCRQSKKVRVCVDQVWREVGLPANSFSFMFLGQIMVTYQNDNLRNTYGEAGVKPTKWEIVDTNGATQTLESESVGGDIAYAVRERRISRISIHLR